MKSLLSGDKPNSENFTFAADLLSGRKEGLAELYPNSTFIHFCRADWITFQPIAAMQTLKIAP